MSGGDGNVTWVPTDVATGKGPRLEAVYIPDPDDPTSEQTVALPPQKFPLLGLLNSELALKVRANITDTITQFAITSQRAGSEEGGKKRITNGPSLTRKTAAGGGTQSGAGAASGRRPLPSQSRFATGNARKPPKAVNKIVGRKK